MSASIPNAWDFLMTSQPRVEQRRRYDERRRDLLPKHGCALVVLEVDEFAHD
jgi:hypothetical protein